MDQVRKKSPLLHESVAIVLTSNISAGELQPGDRLPSEREMSEQFDVSRATIRHAIASLADDGLLVRRAGLGNFVAQPTISEPASKLRSFTELAASRGLPTSSVVLWSEVREATLDESHTFKIASSARIFLLDRVRYLDTTPISIDRSKVPLRICPQLPHLDFSTASLYTALDNAGSGPARADYSIRAIVTNSDDARLLHTNVGQPLLHATTVSYSKSGALVELGEMRYRGDRYRFEASLTR